MNELRQAALYYAEHGLRVMPLKPRGKEPLTAHGCKDATKSPGQIDRWWNQWPDANVGIAAGNGLLVIDMDNDPERGIDGVHELDMWQQNFGGFPVTWTALTGRLGSHLYYKCYANVKNRVGVLEGVDIRSYGGFVVAPPSLHANGRKYEWEIPPDEMPIAEANDIVMELVNYQAERHEHFTMPQEIPQGERNKTLFRSACSLQSQGYSDQGIKALIKTENLIRCTPPMDDQEIDKILDSVLLRYPKGGLEEWTKKRRELLEEEMKTLEKKKDLLNKK